MTCPSPEALLAFAEGADDPSLTAHVAGCEACRAQLAELGSFETLLAGARTLPDARRQQLRTATEQLLRKTATAPSANAAIPLHPRRSYTQYGLLLLAALLLTTLSLWPHADGLRDLAVHRHTEPGTTRQGELERWSLSLRLAEPRWLAVWSYGPEGLRRLLPDADAPVPHHGVVFPLAAGVQRVPASDLLDFEFAPARAPRGVVVVPFAKEPTAAELAELETLVRGGEPAQFTAPLQQKHREARVLPFPSR